MPTPLPAPLANAVLLPLSSIHASPFQPRQKFSEVEMNDLADSIREHGVLNPILVRTKPSAYDGSVYELIGGERRWRAAAAAGLESIPAIVRECDDKTARALAIIDNIQRVDLTPLEESEAIWVMMTEEGLTIRQVATRISKSRGFGPNEALSDGWVNNRLALRKTGEDVQRVAAEAPNSMSSLLLIEKVKEPETRRDLLETVLAGAPHLEVKSKVEAHQSAVDAQKKADEFARRAPDSQTETRANADARGESSSMSRGKRVKGPSKAEANAEALRGARTMIAWTPHCDDKTFAEIQEMCRRVVRGDLSR